jgi:hypothetical protein
MTPASAKGERLAANEPPAVVSTTVRWN